ncbi:uncharacterized protein ColSpa_08671 [Colletotrichum spaethianum]|uniref:Uncharacterized protein n=1 Tax=Colletotrichum spaethianum TaxID=700344 RepID=A0AA37PAA0_9PEZI|nr:uncharacterized protein ColSpa_08671 [Colletotrichum spaethianum]GKT48490.1 hypothetical protein ColSpa_08671 [Colletotrichum spaethianum]
MKYSVFTLLAVAAAFVAAAPAEAIEKRQDAVANSVPVDGSAMTDANGNIVPFNSAGVYQANKEAGL